MNQNSPVSDPEDRDLNALRDAEQARKRRGLSVIGGALLGVALVIGGIVALTGGRQGPSLPIEQSERDDAAKSNDPACRAMIAEITAHGDTWRALDVRLAAEVFGQDATKAPAAIAELEALHAAVLKQRAASGAVALRFEPSRGELNDWFESVDKTLQLLIWLARSHNNPTPPPPPFKIVEPDRKPEQMRLSAIASIHDSFEGFRVWHTSGLHPCGAAGAAPVAPAAPAAPVVPAAPAAPAEPAAPAPATP